MKLDKRQFCIAVETYKEMMDEEEDIAQVLDIGPEWKGAEWIQNYYDLLSDLCELEEDPYVGSDLDWFCYETNFGRREDMCKVYDVHTGHVWTITTPDILYDFITREW